MYKEIKLVRNVPKVMVGMDFESPVLIFLVSSYWLCVLLYMICVQPLLKVFLSDTFVYLLYGDNA